MSEILAHDVSVVLVGNLNPTIFSPSWFQLAGLIDQQDADSAEVNVIHPQVTDFKISQFGIRVQPNSFTISTTEEPFVPLSDWIKIIFGELLPHTPLGQAAINYSVHFASKTQEQRHKLGRLLAPVEPWGEWGKTLEADEINEMGGLRTLSMMQAVVPGRKRGYRQVRVEPSVREDIVSAKVGIYMNVNDHFEVAEEADGENPMACVEWVLENFDDSLASAKSIVSHIQELVATL